MGGGAGIAMDTPTSLSTFSLVGQARAGSGVSSGGSGVSTAGAAGR